MAEPALPLQPAADQRIATVAKAMGDPLRVTVLQLLARDSFAVAELCLALDMAQPALSHHLKVLANAGLVRARREGTASFYRRTLPAADDPAAPLVHGLWQAIDSTAPRDEVQRRLDAVQAQRAERSRSFFADRAAAVREQQALIAGTESYAGAVEELLALVPDGASALDMGPGTGELLPLLASRFSDVLAADLSAPLLEQARALCAEQALTNVRFGQADIDALPDDLGPVDLVLASMVLHHARRPERTLADLSARLEPGGHLLVVELGEHSQAWAREACGDVWLGFDPDTLLGWLTAAGLQPLDSLYLGQRNGFRVHLHLATKPLDTPEPTE